MTIGLSKEEIGELAEAILKEWKAERTEPLKPLTLEEGLFRIVNLLGRLFFTIIVQNNEKIEADLRTLGLMPD